MSEIKCFVDIETTGLNPEIHEIIEICIIRCVEGFPPLVWVEKLSPQRLDLADPRALDINRFTIKEWYDAKEQEEAARMISELTKDAILIGHNIRFDESFIAELLHQHGVKALYKRRLIDTITLAHEHIPHIGSLSLENIREYYNWNLEGAHRAKKDALDCMRLYHRLYRCSVFSRAFWRIMYQTRKIVRYCKRWIK